MAGVSPTCHQCRIKIVRRPAELVLHGAFRRRLENRRTIRSTTREVTLVERHRPGGGQQLLAKMMVVDRATVREPRPEFSQALCPAVLILGRLVGRRTGLEAVDVGIRLLQSIAEARAFTHSVDRYSDVRPLIEVPAKLGFLLGVIRPAFGVVNA